MTRSFIGVSVVFYFSKTVSNSVYVPKTSGIWLGGSVNSSPETRIMCTMRHTRMKDRLAKNNIFVIQARCGAVNGEARFSDSGKYLKKCRRERRSGRQQSLGEQR